MSTGDFTLPGAWLCAAPAEAGHRVEVDYADLAPALDALAVSAGAEPFAVPAAAHIKVLNTLVEEPAFRTDVLPAGGREVRAMTVRPGAARTWRELVVQAGRALRAMPPAPGPDEGASRADRVLLAAAPDTAPATGRHGLCVGVSGAHTLILHAAGHIGAAGLDRLAVMYRRVLEAMAEAPDGDAVTTVLPDGERDAVLRRWAVGRTVTREPADVLELFRNQAARTPDAPAVRADGRALSYRELDEASTRLAHHLLAHGASPEVPVGVGLRRGPDLLPTLLGIWKCGAPYLPLDADLPRPRLRHMVSAAGCALIVTRSELLPALGPFDQGEYILLDRDRDAIDTAGLDPIDVPVGPADLAYVIYTSGSTGAPKGVMVHHGGLANYVLWTALEYAARGIGGSPHFSSIGFDLGVPSLFAPLVVGQRVDLLPDPLDAADLGGHLLAGAPYSFIKMTPGHLNLLSTDLEPEEAHGLAGLVIAAGDAFPVELARRWGELTGPGGTPVATEYGPTEITVGNSGQVVTRLPADGLVPLGLPIPNTAMYVLDDSLEPVPDGVPGEVYVGGAGVARGYLGAPALTAERFLPDPYGEPGARLYRTGDRGRWRQGRLEFMGRTDHQVKIRGYRVEPGEVRAAILRCPDVGDAVVTAYPGPSGAQRLAAFVVPAAEAGPDLSRVRAELAQDLPDYMVPADLRTVREIPLTANGKVDTHALRTRL
ncbi:amino acid adenylation domain-containing protein [Streptomyces sp. SM10]|uniref:amino acid adenylation domain-containing protein n=1 Tax=Streptomyces sp. SM10 TaxID=565556 RepID=UPI000CD5214C|nr:amino acid adenylation domain-containing protein [Streptomyces sp. SM10]